MPRVRQSYANDDGGYAPCPFRVTSISTPSHAKRTNSSKKRKRGTTDRAGELIQEWPFNPSAAFQKRRMEVSYTVEPRQKWLGLRRYNSFILNHVKYRKEDFVYIANSATVERQNAVKVDPGQAVRPQPADHWVAKILEIRAADEHHVYARIYWMYSPNDLPPDTVASGKLASEQQTQHNQQELVASNHMDIINVASVVRPATVKHPVDREDMQDAGVIYWRQAFDYITSELFLADEGDRSRTSNTSDSLLVMRDTNEEGGHAVPQGTLLEGKTEYAHAEQHNAGTNEGAEIPCPSTGDIETSSTKSVCSQSVDGVSHGDCLELNQASGISGFLAPTGLVYTATTTRTSTTRPEVSPVYLPSKSQHALLKHLQDILETTCYQFGKRVMPDVLQRRGWDCAESAELNSWTKELLRRHKSFAPAQIARKRLKILFRSIANIRHSAVHRRKVSVKGIEQFLIDAEALTMLLRDAERTRKIAMLRREMHVILQELDQYWVLLCARLGGNSGQKMLQRADLHYIEGNGVSAMEKEARDYLCLVGRRVEAVVASSMVGISSVAHTT